MPTTVTTRLARTAARCRTSPVDVLLALAVTVLVVGELVVSNTRQPAVVVPVAGLAMATLAWRRAAPTTVAVVVLLASLLISLTAQGEFPPQLPFVADLLAVYTAASCLAGRRAWVAGALTLALVWVSHSVTGDGDPGDFLPALVWGAPWAAGRLVRRRLLEAAQVATDAALAVQQHDEQLREAAARERDRIARELHDVVAHGVSLMVVQAGAERLRLGADAPQTRDVLDDIERAGRTALAELRTMLAVLRAPDGAEVTARTPQPTLTDLPELVERVRDAGVTVQLDADLAADVPATVGLSAYRIVAPRVTGGPLVVRRGAAGGRLRLFQRGQPIGPAREPINGCASLLGTGEPVDPAGRVATELSIVTRTEVDGGAGSTHLLIPADWVTLPFAPRGRHRERPERRTM